MKTRRPTWTKRGTLPSAGDAAAYGRHPPLPRPPFLPRQPYPWKSPQDDLAAAETLINDCGYHRRDEELADAKRAILELA